MASERKILTCRRSIDHKRRTENAGMGAGWEIHTSGAGAPDIWYVAIPDISEAMEAVAHKSGAIIDSRCIRRELSTRDIKSLGVAPGSVKLAPKPGET